MALGFSYLVLVLVLCGIWAQASIANAVGELPSTLHGEYLTPTLHSRDDKTDLRILCLGASITWGVGSSTGNGYRKPLRDKLRFEGYNVDMVGTKHNGNMVDNDVEAHPGDVIDQVHTAARGSYRYNPNLVLINAGTNDCLQNRDIAGAGERMRVLVEDLFQSISGVTVILSTLIPCKDPKGEANRPAVNAQFRTLVNALRGEGRSIILADMDPPAPDEGSGWLDVNTDYYDNIHPNDMGYPKMAAVWYQAISTASKDTLLKKPGGAYVVTPGSNGLQCDKHYGDGVYAGGLTQRGSGEDDGIYRHDSTPMGTVLTVESDYDRNQWFFARLFARERDDFVGWYERDDGSQWYGVWRNTGDAANLFTKIADMNVSIACIPRGVNFIDVNADGLDDFVCIGPGGDAYASINQGDGDIGSGKPPSFKDIGQIKDAVSGYPQAQVRLGDVDGDGRADYCVFDPAGDMTCWRNGWIEDKPAYWQGLGQRFSGKNMGNLTGVRLEDINGDGRDDWVWIGDTGEAYMYSNSRSCQHGTDGDGLNVAWRQGFWQGTSSGPTYNGMGVDGVRERIHFARIYGEPEDFGLLGRQDYVYLEHSKDGERHKFAMRVWQNKGSGSTKLKADGNKYCNMKGHTNGMDDYVWTLSKGRMTLYPNRGMDSVVDGGPSFWDASEVIFDPSTFGRMLDRRDLHLADWDGDGACDIIWVDPDNQNRVQLWRNTYKETGTWNWDYNANPAPDLYCPEKRGIGIFDLPVQFADISGNGKADYLCIEKDGRTWGWIHNDANGWDYIDQFKYSEQKDRANLRWADVNGDGKADLIWTDKFSGDGTVWYNNGPKDVKGSRYEWVPQGKLYQGNHAGGCMYYPDFQGDNRADMHAIRGTFTNEAETWFNTCGAGDNIGDDGQQILDPKLPVQPGNKGSSNPGWMDENCSDDKFQEGTKAGALWDRSMAGDAWNDAVASWKDYSTHPIPDDQDRITFSQFVSSRFFGGPEGMHCERYAEGNGCGEDSELQCASVGITSPAGKYILNSFKRLDAVLWNLHDALEGVLGIIESEIDTFADTFAPLPDDGITLGTILGNLLGMGYGSLSSRLWEKVMEKIDDDAANEVFSNAEEYADSMADSAFEKIKDVVDGNPADYVVSEELKKQVVTIITAWDKATADTQSSLFSGTDDGIKQLGNMIAGGTFLLPNDTQLLPITDLKASVERSLYGMLIPQAWRLALGDINPFVIDSTMNCADALDQESKDTNPEGFGDRALTDYDTSRVCINDRMYYLVTATKPAENCVDSPHEGLGHWCKAFPPPPGADDLDGSSWGNITIEDIVAGAVNTYHANGKNPDKTQGIWDSSDYSNTFAGIGKSDVSAPGYVDIPMCRYWEARENYWYYRGASSHDDVPFYFPCNEQIDYNKDWTSS